MRNTSSYIDREGPIFLLLEVSNKLWGFPISSPLTVLSFADVEAVKTENSDSNYSIWQEKIGCTVPPPMNQLQIENYAWFNESINLVLYLPSFNFAYTCDVNTRDLQLAVCTALHCTALQCRCSLQNGNKNAVQCSCSTVQVDGIRPH